MRQFEAEKILSQYKIHTYKDVKEACDIILSTFKEENKKQHIHAEIIIAWANGSEIEFLNEENKEWQTIKNPSWLLQINYRVKEDGK